MNVLDFLISGTQFVGNIANYWHIFVMFISMIVLMFVFYYSIKDNNWPPECDKDGKPPSGAKICGPSKPKFLMILGGIIFLLFLAIYISWTFRDNKYYEIAQGVGVEGNLISKLF